MKLAISGQLSAVSSKAFKIYNSKFKIIKNPCSFSEAVSPTAFKIYNSKFPACRQGRKIIKIFQRSDLCSLLFQRSGLHD